MKPAIRLAVPADLPALLEIERESFPNPHWRAEDFVRERCLVAETEGRIVGLLVSRETYRGDATTLPEREIMNLAVTRGWRRLGIATALLNHELSQPASYFLEVRESNVAAQQLYRKFGFIAVGKRSGYYQFPTESAIVMQMK